VSKWGRPAEADAAPAAKKRSSAAIQGPRKTLADIARSYNVSAGDDFHGSPWARSLPNAA